MPRAAEPPRPLRKRPLLAVVLLLVAGIAEAAEPGAGEDRGGPQPPPADPAPPPADLRGMSWADLLRSAWDPSRIVEARGRVLRLEVPRDGTGAMVRVLLETETDLLTVDLAPEDWLRRELAGGKSPAEGRTPAPGDGRFRVEAVEDRGWPGGAARVSREDEPVARYEREIGKPKAAAGPEPLLREGERITVRGSLADTPEGGRLTAGEILRGDRRTLLRDAAGNPLWLPGEAGIPAAAAAAGSGSVPQEGVPWRCSVRLGEGAPEALEAVRTGSRLEGRMAGGGALGSADRVEGGWSGARVWFRRMRAGGGYVFFEGTAETAPDGTASLRGKASAGDGSSDWSAECAPASDEPRGR